MLPCLMLCLASCASKPAIRTETVRVNVPAYIALPTDLLRPCIVDVPATWTNGSLIDYAIRLKSCLATANDQLTKIRGLQP